MSSRHAVLWLLGFSAFTGALSYFTAQPPVVAQTADATSYTPQAPPESYQAALRSNLKSTRDWIEMKDFQSAAQSQRLVVAVVQLYALRSNDDKHKEQITKLRTACDKVGAAIRSKNADATRKAIAECEETVAALNKAPVAEIAIHKNFKPFGNTNTWMTLMDCSVIDAEDAKTADDFQYLTLAVAEQANVTEFLRADAKWRQFAGETRAVALKASEAAKKDGLEAGRAELKKIKKTCAACHAGYKRP